MSTPTSPPTSFWLNIDKPQGMGSTDVVRAIKRLFNIKKVGHGGTLDPMATGVLPIAVNEATKTSELVLEGTKAYTAEITFGATTNTDDAEGQITAQSATRPTQTQLESTLKQFTGRITQTPPAFSAIKIDGKPAYKSARDGNIKDIQARIAPRHVVVYKAELQSFTPEKANVQFTVSKGTYIRVLARDIGEALGCLGHLSGLRRTQAGSFNLDTAVPLEVLDKLHELVNGDAQQVLAHAHTNGWLTPMADMLADTPAYHANIYETRGLQLGFKFKRCHLPAGQRKVINAQGELVSLVNVNDDGEVSVVRNFQVPRIFPKLTGVSRPKKGTIEYVYHKRTHR